WAVARTSFEALEKQKKQKKLREEARAQGLEVDEYTLTKAGMPLERVRDLIETFGGEVARMVLVDFTSFISALGRGDGNPLLREKLERESRQTARVKYYLSEMGITYFKWYLSQLADT